MFARTIQLYKNAYQGLSREVWLLALMMLINRSGTMVIPFLTLYLTSTLGFDLGQAGWVMSTFGLGSVVGSLIGGQLTDRIGAFQVMFWALFLSVFGFITLIWMKSFLGVCSVIFLTSTVAESFRPASFSAIADCSPTENRTRAIALVRVAINLGMAIGPAIGGIIAASVGFKYLFIIDGLTCLAAAIFLKIIFSQYFGKKRQQLSEEKTEQTASTQPYQDRRYLFLLLLVFFNAIAFFQIFATEPVFFRDEYLLDEGAIGLLLAFNGLLIVATEMPLIYLLEKHLTKVQIVNIGTCLIGFSYFLLIILSPGWISAIISMFFITVGEMLSLPFLSTMALNRGNTSNRGRYMAMFTATYSVAHVVAPNLGLQLVEGYGFTKMWIVIIGFSILACLGFLWMQRN